MGWPGWSGDQPLAGAVHQGDPSAPNPSGFPEAQETPRIVLETSHSPSHRHGQDLGKVQGAGKRGTQWADKFPLHWNTSGQALPEDRQQQCASLGQGPQPAGTTARPEHRRSPGQGPRQGLAFLHQHVGSWRVPELCPETVGTLSSPQGVRPGLATFSPSTRYGPDPVVGSSPKLAHRILTTNL